MLFAGVAGQRVVAGAAHKVLDRVAGLERQCHSRNGLRRREREVDVDAGSLRGREVQSGGAAATDAVDHLTTVIEVGIKSERIQARPARDRVVAGAGGDRVVEVIVGDDRVIAAAALHIRDQARRCQRQRQVRVDGLRGRQPDIDGGRLGLRGGEIQGVDAVFVVVGDRDATQRIVGIEGERIVAAAAVDRFAARARGDRVVARAADKAVDRGAQRQR